MAQVFIVSLPCAGPKPNDVRPATPPVDTASLAYQLQTTGDPS